MEPVSGKVYIKLNKNKMNRSSPKFDCKVQFDKFALNLDEDQYYYMQKLFDLFNTYSKSLPFLKFRPQQNVSQNPIRWWIYACQGIKQSRNKLKPWSYSKVFIRHRKIYTELYAKGKTKLVRTFFTFLIHLFTLFVQNCIFNYHNYYLINFHHTINFMLLTGIFYYYSFSLNKNKMQ